MSKKTEEQTTIAEHRASVKKTRATTKPSPRTEEQTTLKELKRQRIPTIKTGKTEVQKPVGGELEPGLSDAELKRIKPVAKTTKTQSYADRLVKDTGKLLKAGSSLSLNIPKRVMETREALGEFITDLTALSRQFRWKGKMPTRTEVEEYISEAKGVGIPGPARTDNPFGAKNVDEFYNRMAELITQASLGITKTMTFPVSVGFGRTSAEFPEEAVTQIVTSLITTSPFDIVATKGIQKATQITKLDRAAVSAMSNLQRLGRKGQRLLKKILTGEDVTVLEAKMIEKLVGETGVSVSDLRDTSGRLFTKNKIKFDDVGDVAKMVDKVMTDTTGVADYTNFEKVFTDNPPMSSKDLQRVVTTEFNRQTANLRTDIGKLMTIDPDTDTFTAFGQLPKKEQIKLLELYRDILESWRGNAVALGAGVYPDSLRLAEEIFDEAGVDITYLFDNGEDYVNFLANNPLAAADLLAVLNMPVKGGRPVPRGLSESEVEDLAIEESNRIRREREDEKDRLRLNAIVDIGEFEKVVPKIKETPEDIQEPDTIPDIIPDIMEKPDTIPDIIPDVTYTPDTDTPPSPPPVIPDIITEPTTEPPTTIQDTRQEAILRSKLLREGVPRPIVESPPKVRKKLLREWRQKQTRKLKPLEFPGDFRVTFTYGTGAIEVKDVKARTFREALILAQQLRKIKSRPIGVEVEEL